MGRAIEQSLLYQAYSDIVNSPGSPWLYLSCQIKAGAETYTPLKLTRFQISMDLVHNYSDEIYLTVIIPSGDLMKYISPFQDDLMVTLSITRLTEKQQDDDDAPDTKVTRTYRAYLDDQTKQPIESNNDVNQPNTEMANHAEMSAIVLRLEEVLVEQLRKCRTGTNASGVPIHVAEALIDKQARSIQLEDGERYEGIDYHPGHNPVPRSSVLIPDGTPLMDVPDLIQNELGGIYKDALGFYIQQRKVYLWPLYDTNRQDETPTLLRVYIAPDPRTKVVERTWRHPDNSPNVVEIWVADRIRVDDDSVGIMQQYGTAVRFTDPGQMLDGYGTNAEGRINVDVNTNSATVGVAQLANNQQVVRSVGVTSNIYVETSKIAKAKGVKLSMAWHHSLPQLLKPAMAVEVIYDHQGEVRTLNGTLIDALSIVDVEGKGPISKRYRSISALTVFVDRDDPDYKAWVEEGAQGLAEAPQIG